MTFKLGILETDDVAPELLKDFGDYPHMFRQLFAALDDTIEFVTYSVVNDEYPEQIEACDAYLMTGSKADSYANDPWIVKLRDYVRQLHDAGKPLTGICFGHQLIAHTLGGEAGKK